MEPGAASSARRVSGGRTRRELLRSAAGLALGALAGTRRLAARQSTRPAPASRPGATSGPSAPWWMGPAHPQARVVNVRSAAVLNASVPDPNVLAELLDRGLTALARVRRPDQAWQRILGPARRIAVKFNSVGQEVINTTRAMAETLLKALAEAGYRPANVALIEVPEPFRRTLGVRAPARGWGAGIRVGDGYEPLAAYLYEADALINVPFLKTHQIAGMSGCMKNLSHALLRHPARYHDQGCSPYVGQVVGSAPVSSRLKLNLMNALRIVVNNGPEATEQDIVGYGGLLLGFDPVAVDTVGLELLAVERRRLGLPGRLDVRYLAAAGEAGIGRWRPGQLERVRP